MGSSAELTGSRHSLCSIRSELAGLRPPDHFLSYRGTVRRGSVDRTVTPRSFEESYDAAVAAALPMVCAVLAVVVVAFSVEDVFTLDGSDRLVAGSTAAVLAVLLGAVALLARYREIPPHWAHPLTAAAIVATTVQSVVVMVLGDQSQQSSTLLLAAAASGVALLSLRWLVGTLYLIWGGWTVAALVVGASRIWVHYAIGLAVASALAMVINHVRRTAARHLAEAHDAAEAAAVRDHLTGLANRRGLAMVGAQIVEHARRQGDAVHCLFIDIAQLKKVNDHAGRVAGDDVIVAVGEAMREVTRATDVVARWGGDEFCVVGPGPGMAPLELERRVRDIVVLHGPVEQDVWQVQVSAGGAMLAPWDSGTLETLLDKADRELHLRRSLRRESSPAAPRPASAD